MFRTTTLAATAAAVAAVALTAIVPPAAAEAVVYKNRTVGSHEPGTPKESVEYATLDVPTGYARHRANWHRVMFFEKVADGRAIIVDLRPESDTVEELQAERDAFAEAAGDSYEEYAFKVFDEDSPISARWSFSYTEANTGSSTPFVTVLLTHGNRIQVAGKLTERDAVTSIRKHVQKSLAFPG